MRRIHAGFLLGSFSLAVAAACGSSQGSSFDNGGRTGDGGGASSSGTLPGFLTDSGDGSDGGSLKGLPIEIAPVDQVLTINSGDPLPTIAYAAKISATGQIVPASWAIDRGEIGAINLTNGLFTATGTTGGKATITATYEGTVATTTVTVKLHATENGGTLLADAGTGAGGNGGVGGAAPGGSVDNATIAVLHGTPQTDAGLSMLYPYDATVWPRGILAPLLMWQPGALTTYDAISIKLSENAFDFEGVYAANALPFKNHPISQAAWAQLLSSNQGEDVTVTLTFAKGTTAYGPLTMKWKVASAPLKGVVYYNSYGTRLAKNYAGALTATPGVTDKFGGATLAVHGDSTDPVLVAGSDGDASACRVCHSVAANGSVLITQRETAELRKFSTYDLKQKYPGGETVMSPEGLGDGGVDLAPWAWSAIYPDGSMFLNDSSDGAGSTPTGAGQPVNQLWNTVSGGATATPTPVITTGWPNGVRAAYPAFSPDGKGIAFTAFTGAAVASADGIDKRTLGYMPFDKTSNTFGLMRALYTPPQPSDPTASPWTAIYPAFLPTNDAVIFELETEYNGRDYGGTRSRQDTNGLNGDGTVNAQATFNRDHGAHGELWWTQTNVSGTPIPTRLDKLNGLGYLPHGPAGSGHEAGAEETLNYEPTVNPVPSGGYAWVVFTSRRMYGNVATQNPFWSDPRFHDLTTDPTPKKLWVAAIDLNAAPGTDPSHPAFYLPAQELLAGNSRGYWVVDPCKGDGTSCATGDECCGGFCRPDTTTSKLVCSNVVPQCAQEFEKCSTSSDCCDNPNYQCINQRCAIPAPR